MDLKLFQGVGGGGGPWGGGMVALSNSFAAILKKCWEQVFSFLGSVVCRKANGEVKKLCALGNSTRYIPVSLKRT